MTVLDPEHTLDLGNTESSTICYHASYNMLSCILPVAIMQLVAIMQPFAIMQIIRCYHAGYHMLLCGVLTFYHYYYQPSRLAYYHQVIVIASLGALSFEFQEHITRPNEFELA